MLDAPSEFNPGVIDFKTFFLIYVSTLQSAFDGMAFDDNGKTFTREMSSPEVFDLLKNAEQKMDASWVPPIKQMIAGIKWKDYEKKLLTNRESEFIAALGSAGIANWQAKVILAGAKTVSTSLLLTVYDNNFSDVKPKEDRYMRIDSSGARDFIGSGGRGIVEVDSTDGYRLSFRITVEGGATFRRELTIKPYDGGVARPDKLTDFSAFGSLIKDVLN